MEGPRLLASGCRAVRRVAAHRWHIVVASLPICRHGAVLAPWAQARTPGAAKQRLLGFGMKCRPTTSFLREMDAAHSFHDDFACARCFWPGDARLAPMEAAKDATYEPSRAEKRRAGREGSVRERGRGREGEREREREREGRERERERRVRVQNDCTNPYPFVQK